MRGLLTLLMIGAVVVGVMNAGEANKTLALTLAAIALAGLFVWRTHD